MVREHGGEGGLDPGRRDLYLFSLISPTWVQPGHKLAINRAPTEMGLVSAVMTFTPEGADVSLDTDFHTPPGRMALTVPWFVDLERCDPPGEIEGGVIYFPPRVTDISLVWKEKEGIHRGTFQKLLSMYRSEYGYIKDRERFRREEPPEPFLTIEEQNHPPAPMSFDLVRKAFVHEYQRRFAEHVQAGGKPLHISSPGLTKLSPVRASASLAAYPPSGAFDGDHKDLQSSWQTDPYPAWWQLDLERPKTLKGLHVYPYWGGGRYYRYTVEVSRNGVRWRQVGDRSDNTAPSTPEGDRFNFEPVEVRYIRVNMLYHNLNKGVHLVEVVPLEAD
jgi:hypothetical protein